MTQKNTELQEIQEDEMTKKKKKAKHKFKQGRLRNVTEVKKQA